MAIWYEIFEVMTNRALARDLVTRPGYYATSFWARLYPKFTRRGLFNGGVYAKSERALADYESIVVVLDSPMMHIGDQLFFLPLINKLIADGYPVIVQAPKSTAFLFPKSCLEAKPGRRALHVSRLHVLPKIWRQAGLGVDFFMIDMLCLRIPEPIGLFIARCFCRHFGIGDVRPETIRETIARPMPLRDDLKHLADGPVIILANYIDSGRHMYNPESGVRMLKEISAYKAASGGTVVHLGTAADRLADTNDYSSVVDVDLRGRTSVADLFGLFANLGISMVYTFDTAVLHIARMYDVPVQVYWKAELLPDVNRNIMRIYGHFFDPAPARAG